MYDLGVFADTRYLCGKIASNTPSANGTTPLRGRVEKGGGRLINLILAGGRPNEFAKNRPQTQALFHYRYRYHLQLLSQHRYRYHLQLLCQHRC